MKKLLCLVSLFIPLFTLGQVNISGKIFDVATRQPVPYATVYVNGTTIGTITNDEGVFALNVPGSSVVVISHVSYHPKTILAESGANTELTIFLQAKDIDLSEIKVEDKSLRQKNIEIFKQLFLGADRWGENAQLKNDSVLLFHHEYDYQKLELNGRVKNSIKSGYNDNICEWGKDSTYVVTKNLSVFNAEAKAPLIIDIPLLGYKLQVDLIEFMIEYSGRSNNCTFLGYFYFQPYQTERRSKTRKIENNRQAVYYNSSQHFFRSLYNKSLAQNGYELLEKKKDETTKKILYSVMSIDSCINYTKDNQMQIVGLNEKDLIVLYFHKPDGSPVDICTHKKGNHYLKSEIYFMNDTCVVNRTGTIPNNDIMFGGEISAKKVGTFLPDDYVIGK